MGGVKNKIMSRFKTNTTNDYSKAKHVKNLYRKKKKQRMREQSKDNVIKDRISRDIRNIFGQEEDYYKLGRIGNFHSKNYLEYQGNNGRNNTLSIKVYLDEIKSELKNIMDNLKKPDKWKI